MVTGLKIKSATRWQAILAAALLLAAGASRAELAGRFFFTPQERSALDDQRYHNSSQGKGESSITVNGRVTRGRGKDTVWINGAPQHESEQIVAPKKKSSPGEIAVKLPGSSQVRTLKVGQTLTPANGQIREAYQRAPQSATAPGDSNNPKK